MLTYYVNNLTTPGVMDFTFQTNATLSAGCKIKFSGSFYTVASAPTFGGGNQAWVDVNPA